MKLLPKKLDLFSLGLSEKSLKERLELLKLQNHHGTRFFEKFPQKTDVKYIIIYFELIFVLLNVFDGVISKWRDVMETVTRDRTMRE